MRTVSGERFWDFLDKTLRIEGDIRAGADGDMSRDRVCDDDPRFRGGAIRKENLESKFGDI